MIISSFIAFISATVVLWSNASGGPGDLALPAISFVAKAVTALFAC